MATTTGPKVDGTPAHPRKRWGSSLLTSDPVRMFRMVRKGFAFKELGAFHKASGLALDRIAELAGISKRTLTRRQVEGRLRPDESDRLLRIWRVFDLAVTLFEYDCDTARQWLDRPQSGLGGETPLDFATTDVGAREVEKLITRLEHGVFT